MLFHAPRAEAVVAEVGPGDMLVVPPYWFHHVETLEESVSVNVWSDAPEYDLMNQMYVLLTLYIMVSISYQCLTLCVARACTGQWYIICMMGSGA